MLVFIPRWASNQLRDLRIGFVRALLIASSSYVL